MKYKITTIIALLAMMVALTGIASAFDIKFVKPDGSATNPVFMRNGDNLKLALVLGETTNLRPQDFGITSDISLVYTGCTGVNCEEADANVTLLKDNITATSAVTIQPDTLNLTMDAPLDREPGAMYAYIVATGPFAEPPAAPAEAASVSLTLVLEGANITGMKFNDINGDGIKGVTEPGLPGWKIILRDQNGIEIANTTTGPGGEYNFTNLRGNFSVEEVLQSGWNQTFPADKTYNVTVDAEDITDLDFGNVALVGIFGMKFNDLNQNGVNNGEPGLAGWTIILRNKDTGAIVDTTVTDSSGNYNFSNLLPGNYTIDEVQQVGWIQSAPIPVPPGNYSVTLAGVSLTGLDFGNYRPPTPSQPGPGKVIGWGILGSSGSFNIWVYTNFLPNGKMEFTDKTNNIVIKATSFDSVITDITAVPKTGTITGMATVNGAGPYAFTVKVVDAADPGAGKDTFTIDVSSPIPYHNSGTLTMGDITVVK